MTSVLYCVAVFARPPQPLGIRGQGSGRPQAAAPSSRAAAQHRPQGLDRAQKLLEGGSTDRAISLLRDVLREDPSNSEAHILLGAALALIPERSQALQELRAGVELAPASARAHYTLGTALARFAEFSEARAAFEKAIELDPKFARAHVDLALVLAQQKELALARQHLQKAIELEGSVPSAAYPHYLLAQIFWEQKELHKAHQELERAIRLRPDYAEACLSLGRVRKELLDGAGAIEAFKKAVELSPTDPSAQYELGAAYLRGGNAALAVEHLQKASALRPGDRPTLYQLCRALERAKRTEEAKACALKVSAITRSEITVSDRMLAAAKFNNEGVELEKAENLIGALEKYRTAVQLNPSRTVFRRNLGLVLCRLGRWDEGIVELREVLKMDPNDDQATKALYIALENALAAKNPRPSAAPRRHRRTPSPASRGR